VKSYYFKFKVPFNAINTVLEKCKFSNIRFFIDILSIARGLYNKSVILMELDNYFTNKELPKTMINEARQFYNQLYKTYKYYNPIFVTFYDYGVCLQNTGLSKGYKDGRSTDDYFSDDLERDLFKKIKEYYLQTIYEQFNKVNLSYVVNLEKYESDLVPYFVIRNNLIECGNTRKTLNVILSTDKDLLQCCRFKNTIQCITTYKPKESRLDFKVYHRNNAISYFYKKFKDGLGITAEFVPLILALAGDKADNIEGIRGVGYAKAYQLILKHKLPPVIDIGTDLPPELEKHRKLIIRNLDLIDFERQISRLPTLIRQNLTNQFQNLKHNIGDLV